MRIAVIGNSGSGKSTLARSLAGRLGAPVLDLDTVAWEPGQIAVARSPEAAQSEVRAFCSSHEHWVVEGCYASLVKVALEFSPRLLFLLSWVSAYYSRDGEMSLAGHRACFDAYPGAKEELTGGNPG